MKLSIMSNLLLAIGIIMLAAFGVMHVGGAHADPLMPASAAFFIGCTAVIDRFRPEQAQ